MVAARKALEGPWKKVTPGERCALLHKLADYVEQNLKTIAAVESLDNGKSVAMATADVTYVVGCLRYYAGWADKVEGKVIDTGPETFNYVKKEPVSILDTFSGFATANSSI